MDSVVGKLFNSESDEEVHREFVKFGKGLFKDRYLIEGKKQASAWSIKTSAEFSNYLVKEGLKKVNGNIDVKGVIISTFDVSDKTSIQIDKVKKYMGIQQAIVNTSVNAKDLLDLMDREPKVHYGLSFKTQDFQLKIKEKAPKSGKPGKKGEDGPKADFCSVKTTDRKIVDELFFDCKEFKEVKIKHEIEVDEIEIPKGVTNPKELREKSVRKGKIYRYIDLDGNQQKKEVSFVA